MKKYQIKVEMTKADIVSGLQQVLEELLLEIHGDKLEEDIRDFELYTNDQGAVFRGNEYTDYLWDVVTDERAATIVNTINVLVSGRVLKIKEV